MSRDVCRRGVGPEVMRKMFSQDLDRALGRVVGRVAASWRICDTLL